MSRARLDEAQTNRNIRHAVTMNIVSRSQKCRRKKEQAPRSPLLPRFRRCALLRFIFLLLLFFYFLNKIPHAPYCMVEALQSIVGQPDALIAASSKLRGILFTDFVQWYFEMIS